MPKIAKIIGPPGCGKTYYCLQQIEKACEKYEPEKIGAVSFTKAAVSEMKKRVSDTMGHRGGAARNIRTIHSHAFKLLGLEKQSVVQENSNLINDWNEKYPHWFLPAEPNRASLEDEPWPDQPCQISDFRVKLNQETYNRMQIFRNQRLPLDKWFDTEAVTMYHDWIKWLREEDLWDFTLILEDCLKRRLRPDIDVLFVDESQDLSRPQLDITRLWAEECDTVAYMGDADQAIYVFAGSCPDDFRDLKHDWGTVLSQSYRVSSAVHDYSSRLIKQIQDREDALYRPIRDGGVVRPASTLIFRWRAAT